MATKVHEWVAHYSCVTCVALGNKTKTILASGGEDKRVNIWKLRGSDDEGGATTLCSLGGHLSAVSCLCFDEEERELVSGGGGGTVRVYDLETGGATKRTLSGHRNRVNVVHLHPFGEFVASGGADAHLKIWDARRKACIQSYKGDGGGIESLRFSPDGKWVASCASNDQGSLRVWDLTAGKLLKSIQVAPMRPAVSATRIEFSPIEFVLAAACTDRTTRLYDLELFQLLAATPPDPVNIIKTLCFSNSGKSVLSLSDSSLRQWSRWDTPGLAPRLALYENLGWDHIDICTLHENKCLAVAKASNFVSIWSCLVDPEDDDNQRPQDENAIVKNDEAKLPFEIVRRIKINNTNLTPSQPKISRPNSTDDAKSTRRESKSFSYEKQRNGSARAPLENISTEIPRTAPPALKSEAKSETPSKIANPSAPEKPRFDDTASLLTEMLLGRATTRALEARLEALRTASRIWVRGDAIKALDNVRHACSTAPLADLDPVAKWCLVSDFLGTVEFDPPNLDSGIALLMLFEPMLADYARLTSTLALKEHSRRAAPRHLKVAIDTIYRVTELFASYIVSTVDSVLIGVDLAQDERRARCEKAKRLFLNIVRHIAAIRRIFSTHRRLDDAAMRLEKKLQESFR
eukprot:CAMPEP_0197285724 /NCGR_PEP_ID=MMETSP0890-20130614/1090_1 /TAXON_ID=44058 ORGANISM="Aureoumbra lagunensis, Strain CCMP1510" /NCGR_SAMPLE_ID=MMETSP0890 /ASSEMBLY_ACC=CAM_ASM_000533 /LENGTH=632 /DNA_ID=CAMNT_0042753519 /DNA_START=26 /DNA_END=1924 /DNA_ORIENTATION=+